MKKHLAIFNKEGIEQIISGKKTIESRFSKNRIEPFGQVNVGDIVYMKPSGKDIVGQFEVKKVINFEGLDKKDWELIKNHYWKDISLWSEELDRAFLKEKQTARFATLIFIGNVEQFIASPVTVKKSDRRGWVVLAEASTK